jgi:hypothetical protein
MQVLFIFCFFVKEKFYESPATAFLSGYRTFFGIAKILTKKQT